VTRRTSADAAMLRALAVEAWNRANATGYTAGRAELAASLGIPTMSFGRLLAEARERGMNVVKVDQGEAVARGIRRARGRG
jgi:DNA-binding transcriptional regulator LsrR (DeoR family)